MHSLMSLLYNHIMGKKTSYYAPIFAEENNLAYLHHILPESIPHTHYQHRIKSNSTFC